MEHVLRRAVSVPSTVIIGCALLLTAPIWLPVAALFDLVTSGRRFPIVRILMYGTYFAGCEVVAVWVAFSLWVVSGFGRHPMRGAYVWMQAAWLSAQMLGARTLLGIQVEPDGELPIPAGNVVILSRHTTLADTLLPAYLMLALSARSVHYVLKRELQWLPSLDIYGQRLGNVFVVRGGDTDNEVRLITELGAAAAPEAALVIFPEGTYNTESKRAQVEASLRSRGRDNEADYAASLDHLLPPKTAGTLALLGSQPDASVVVVGHYGFDGISEPGALRQRIPAQTPIVMRWWIHERSEVHDYSGGQEAWLRDRWSELDAWVGGHSAAADRGSSNAYR